MKSSRQVTLFLWFTLTLALVLVSAPLWADNKPQNQVASPQGININSNNARTIDRSNTNTNNIANNSTSSISDISSSSNSSGTGGEANITYARQAPPIFMYPSNQVEACGRTFGISGSNTSGAWAFGLPIPRSWTPTCDLWKASNEAQENGHVYTSYMFQCSIRSIRKVWGEESCLEFETRSMIELGFIQEEAGVWVPVDEYDGLLMAQVSKEEYEEQQELVEYRQAQQENLIDSLQQEHESDEKEIKELKAVVTKALKERDEQRVEEEQRAASFAEIYSKYEAQEEEPENE